MIRPNQSPCLILLIALATSGCAFFQSLDPGADPLVVSAEQTAGSARSVMDNFLAVERDNELFIKARLPEIHGFANEMRDKFPAMFEQFRAATKAYKQSRSKDDAQNMNQLADNLSAAAATARRYLIQYRNAHL